MKEGALALLASLAEAGHKQFSPYLKDFVQLLFNIFQSHNGKQYMTIRGLVLEALTVIADSAEDENQFRPYIPNTVQLFIRVSEGAQKQEENDKYVLVGWQRLCQRYAQDLR